MAVCSIIGFIMSLAFFVYIGKTRTMLEYEILKSFNIQFTMPYSKHDKHITEQELSLIQ